MSEGIKEQNVLQPEVIFSSTKQFRNAAVLQSPNDFTFHLWTQRTSCYHTHEDYIEIFIVTKGKLVHHFGKEKIVMQTGDAFIMLPEQRHKHSPYKNYASQHINLTCRIPFAKEMFKLYFETDSPHFQYQLIHLNAKTFEMALTYQQLVLGAKTEETHMLLVKSFVAFAFSLFHTSKNTEEEEKHIPEWLQDFIQKLNNLDFTADFNLSDIYAWSNYSQTTLSREFKKHMGQTLISYINDLKLNYACNQLKHTDLPILAISSSLGFDSLSHFSHLFKKKYGIPPLQYRKN